MTRSLLINCSLKSHAKNERLHRAIQQFSECSSVSFRDIPVGCEVDPDVDAIVISGSAARIVNPFHRELFKSTIDFIRTLTLPLFSICFGYQLLCWSLGARVASLSEPIKDRFEEVNIIEVDEIFVGFDKFQRILLAQSHYDYVLKASLDDADLILLADSGSCEVEAVKHKSHPFYGVQFHPERTEIKGKICIEGNKILENFFSVAKR